MKKAVKVIVGIIIVLLILVIGLIATLPMTISPLVKKGAAAAGPKVLGVDVSVGDVQLKPIAGQLVISDLVVGNPAGYSKKPSFAVTTVAVNLKTISLLKGDTIQIEKILIEAPEISYETKAGKSNFDAILAKAKRAEKAERPEGAKHSKKKPGKKVVVDEFILNGSKVSYASAITFGKPVTVPLPPITVNDIGKDDGGASMVEAINKVIAGILGGLQEAITKVASGSAGALKGVGKEATKALKSVSKGGAEAISNVAQGATGAVGGATKDATEKAGELSKGAADAANEAAEAAGDAVKDASKKLKGLFGK